MPPFSITPLGGSAGTGGALTAVGDGPLVKVGSKTYVIDPHAVWPLRVTDGNGIKNNPVWEFVPTIAEQRDMDLTTVGDISVRSEAYMYTPTRLILGLPIGTLDAGLSAALYTRRGRQGDLIQSISAAELATLTDKRKQLVYDLQQLGSGPTGKIPRFGDWLYFSLSAANSTPMKLSLWMYGDVQIASDDKGLPL